MVGVVVEVVVGGVVGGERFCILRPAITVSTGTLLVTPVSQQDHVHVLVQNHSDLNSYRHPNTSYISVTGQHPIQENEITNSNQSEVPFPTSDLVLLIEDIQIAELIAILVSRLDNHEVRLKQIEKKLDPDASPRDLTHAEIE
ncbi:hypothetical protein RhiirA4_487722 [Rhizophagus irregularis]|uniref:Uncharacterized protein n=1 Tax=Rhizophagus irregularis TaxID=588596 RepID=A0A2I1HSX2_9GLOM|nr:hypothetical protein RhiirA4_487722 [Rhizophagus irregularis]